MNGGGRRGRRRWRAPASLPTSTSTRRTEHTVSSWYCDCKIYAFNVTLFSLGWKYARSGSLSAWLKNLLTSGHNRSIMDTTIIIMSTILSIAFHEFGHAIAAASEGLEIEYVAIFIAVIFPGAFVALNYDLLQNLPLFSMLRIYCAGIWHNVMIRDKLPCPDELIAFEKVICNGSTISTEKTSRGSDPKEVEEKYCLIAKDVVKLRKCGNGWLRTEDDGSNCACFEDEYCLVPVLTPGFSWIEVSYSKPYSWGCLQKGANLSSSASHAANNDLGHSPCEGSFVYLGNLLSAARSVRLSPYQPRWALLFIADIPYILGNGLNSLLHASAALAVVNCLPKRTILAEFGVSHYSEGTSQFSK
ncbi:hypothetical protein BAE44_0010583 [Dichanthelium oligosanthes]|uniref:Endopeptidase S2P n=1 Tax=Dichanthelium oligosanthes TaxID=888268 RepID=A0A1E5VTH5_9POAL|nr:hypothetical protein BAE44_0010583 [Dichanthelium oligosanthes]